MSHADHPTPEPGQVVLRVYLPDELTAQIEMASDAFLDSEDDHVLARIVRDLRSGVEAFRLWELGGKPDGVQVHVSIDGRPDGAETSRESLSCARDVCGHSFNAHVDKDDELKIYHCVVCGPGICPEYVHR